MINIQKLTSSLSTIGHVVRTTISTNKPTILSVGAMVTVPIFGYETGKATVTTVDTLREMPDATRMEKFKAVYKNWIFPVTLLAATESSIFMANRENAKRIAAALAAYEISDKKLKDFKDAAVETVGEKKVDKIQQKADEKNVQEHPPIRGLNVIDTGTGELIFHEKDITGLYFLASRDFVDKVMAMVNLDLSDSSKDMAVSVSEIIEKLSNFEEHSREMRRLRKMMPEIAKDYGFGTYTTGRCTYEINPVVYSEDPSDSDSNKVIFELELDNWGPNFDDSCYTDDHLSRYVE